MRARVVDAVAAAVPALVLVPMAFVRFVDGDEGIYAYAARLALHGSLPYRDFFYEQTPVLPYVYGGWIGVAGESWGAVRLLSALLGAGVGVLLYVHVLRRFGRRAAIAAVVAFAFSALVFGFFVVVKTFALATLLLVGAFVLVDGRTPSPRAAIAAGALAGVAVDVRLLFLAAVPALAVAARRRLAPFAAGLGVGLVPSVVLFALAPRQFVFDNVGYHLAKDSSSTGDELAQKARIVGNLVGFGRTDHLAGLQVALLVVGAVAAALALRRLSLALWIALLLALACLAPSPTYVQYFSVVVPFALVGLVEAWPRIPWLLVAGAAAYVLAGAIDLPRERAGDPVLKPSLDSVTAVTKRLDRVARPNEPVLSSWPGYLFGSHARALPPFTNHFAPVAAEHAPNDAQLYRVASELHAEETIAAGAPRVVVFRNWLPVEPRARWHGALVSGGYRRVATIEGAGIFVSPG